MSRRTCQRFGDTLSGFVDGVLPDADRERVLAHLVDCLDCRDEVAELRAVRDLLGTRQDATSAPSDLSQRLVSIAGADSDAPLWSRPFSPYAPPRAQGLPSRRRRVRTSVATVALFVGFLGVGGAGVGYLAAPPVAEAIDDPTAAAEAEFSTALSRAPLSSDAVNAVIMDRGAPANRSVSSANRSGPAATGSGPAPQADTADRTAAATHLDENESLQLLGEADRARRTVAHDGLQQVQLWGDGEQTTAQVRVEARPGQGSQVAVVDARGGERGAGFIARSADQSASFDVLADRYELSGATGGEVAGRSATMIQAVADDQVRARWWLDSETGLMLWSETYDEQGTALQSSGYVSVDISDSDDAFLTHLAPRLSARSTSATLSAGHAEELAVRGWGCAQSVAGLPLVQVEGGGFGVSGTLHSSYSDGVTTLSVTQRHGTLTSAPAGQRWDPELSAYRSSAAPAVATWQSGDTVITVVTDASPRVLAAAVADLPHKAPVEQGHAHRVLDGWEHILRSMAQIR